MPCAINPQIRPVSTSPDPAVASHGDAWRLTATRPSGAAMWVCGPFNRTTAPDRCAAQYAAAARSARSISGNSRANSPVCGVMTSFAHRCWKSRAGSPANAVMASASSTMGISRFSSAQTISAMSAPAPGPMASAVTRWSIQANLSSASRSMIAVTCAACSASAARSPMIVTNPAPTAKAACAANRDAPVRSGGPLQTIAWPRLYLCASDGGGTSVGRVIVPSWQRLSVNPIVHLAAFTCAASKIFDSRPT